MNGPQGYVYLVMPSGREKNIRKEGVPIVGILIDLMRIHIKYIRYMRYNRALNSRRYLNKEKPQQPLSVWVSS